MFKFYVLSFWSLRFFLVTVITRTLKGLVAFKIFFLGQDTGYPSVVRKLENKFKDLSGQNYAVSFNSGTSGINAALHSLSADSNKIIGTVGLVIPSAYHGARTFQSKLQYVDTNHETLRIDLSDLEKKIKRIDILVIVHYYGYPCEIEEILELCKINKVALIEDCSHAHGATFDNNPIGSYGHVSVFSLQGAKAVSGGEGGVAVTSSKEILGKLIEYGHQDKRTYDLPSTYNRGSSFGVGHKLRMHPVAAACALIDLKFLKHKNKIFSQLVNQINEIIKEKEAIFSIPASNKSKPAGFCQGIVLRSYDKKYALKLKSSLRSNKVSYFQRNYKTNIEENSKPNSTDPTLERLFETVFYIDLKQFINPRRLLSLINILAEHD